jgi:hypothetical protein
MKVHVCVRAALRNEVFLPRSHTRRSAASVVTADIRITNGTTLAYAHIINSVLKPWYANVSQVRRYIYTNCATHALRHHACTIQKTFTVCRIALGYLACLLVHLPQTCRILSAYVCVFWLQTISIHGKGHLRS